MTKRPFDVITSFFRNANKDQIKSMQYVFEKSDSFSLWILGISVGGISIFASNIADIQEALPPFCLKLVIILLAISVASGIIYRWQFLDLFVLTQNIHRGIDIAFSNKKMMGIESSLNGTESFEELNKKVFFEFGKDLSHLLVEYENSDDNNKLILYNSLVDYYLRCLNFSRKELQETFDFIADTYTKFTGVNKEELLKNFNPPQQKQTDIYIRKVKIVKCLYFIYISAFIAALFLFVFSI